MAVTLVASAHGKGAKPVTVDITVSGWNKLLVVCGLCTGGAGDPGALTIKMGGSGGTDPTATVFSTLTGTYYRSFMAYWTNPPDGATDTYITSPNPSFIWACASVWNGVLQSGPVGTLKTGSALELSGITCLAGNAVIDLITGKQDATTGTPDADWTIVQKDYISLGPGDYGNGGMSYILTTTTSETSTWSGLSNVQLHNAIPLIPGGGGNVFIWS